MDVPYIGPTVAAACEARLREIKDQIEVLTFERQVVLKRLAQFRGSRMLEPERCATAAEPFQRNPLPKENP